MMMTRPIVQDVHPVWQESAPGGTCLFVPTNQILIKTSVHLTGAPLEKQQVAYGGE